MHSQNTCGWLSMLLGDMKKQYCYFDSLFVSNNLYFKIRSMLNQKVLKDCTRDKMIMDIRFPKTEERERGKQH